MLFHQFSEKRILFHNREDAGKELAKKLLVYKNQEPIVLGLPRGGVIVANEVAEALHAPLEVFVARKIGAPHNREFGIGAVAEEDTLFLDTDTMHALGYAKEDIEHIAQEEREELDRRVLLYRGRQPLPSPSDQTVILIDDGLATGVTAFAAIEAIRKQDPNMLVFAAPVCASETAEAVKTKVDDLICLHCPYDLGAIGLYYEDFRPVSDEAVLKSLEKNRDRKRVH